MRANLSGFTTAAVVQLVSVKRGGNNVNCKLARIMLPSDVTESPREYLNDVDIPPTNDALSLAKWTRAILDTTAYAVIDGDSMQAEYIVFEGRIFEPRS